MTYTIEPEVELESFCACGHKESEHEAVAKQPETWLERLLGTFRQCVADEPEKHCGCRGFRPGKRSRRW